MDNNTQTLFASLIIFIILASFRLVDDKVKADSSDYIVVVMNNELIFEAISQDTDLKNSKIEIVDSPKYGSVALNDDYTFTFKPEENLCEEEDFFSYKVNTSKEAYTVSVKVDILCEPIIILSGFTPDGDGLNDTFTILGAENFPNNSLTVFNGDGEEVYYAKSYKNDWDGKVGDAENTEDLIYYYVFHDGEEQYYSGYLKIN